MKYCVAICVFLSFCSVGQQLQAQLKDLTKFTSSKARIEEFLSSADRVADDRTVVYRVTEGCSYKQLNKDVLATTTGIWIVDSKLRLNFCCTEYVPDEGEGRRAAVFFLEKREKGKVYPLAGRFSSKFTDIIELDPDTGGRAGKNKNNFYWYVCPEIDPNGSAVINAGGLIGRHTHIPNVLMAWTSKFKLIDEREEENRLWSRWVSLDKSHAVELVFDDDKGGMPVSYDLYSIDVNMRRTKDSISETRTKWRELDKDIWIPESVQLTSTNSGIDRSYDVKLEYLSIDQHKEIIRSLDWKAMHQDDKRNWFEMVLEAYTRVSKQHAPTK